MTDAELCSRVRASLGQDHRYAHTLRVARLAARLARLNGLDARKARIAGMLHDLARLRAADDLVRECEARGMPIDRFEAAHPIVLHARLGAELARERFGVQDEEVLDAIRLHTLGGPAMPPLACAVFLADALEAGRDYPERAALLETALRDMNAGMRAVLGATVEHQVASGLEVAPQTKAAVHYYHSKENALCPS